MKKMFDKINKIVFVLGIIALVAIVLIIANTNDEVIEGVLGIAVGICVLVMAVFAICAAVSFVLAVIDGLKNDKVAFFKKMVSNIVLMTIAFAAVFVIDYFYEPELAVDYNLPKLILHIIGTACAIIAGEYMITNHNDNAKKELHF